MSAPSGNPAAFSVSYTCTRLGVYPYTRLLRIHMHTCATLPMRAPYKALQVCSKGRERRVAARQGWVPGPRRLLLGRPQPCVLPKEHRLLETSLLTFTDTLLLSPSRDFR